MKRAVSTAIAMLLLASNQDSKISNLVNANEFAEPEP